jgi:hypothetical protein
VALADGIPGYYKPTTCGGTCSPPQVQWVFRRVLYTIQLRVEAGAAGERLLLTRIANSAIRGGPR